VIPGSLGLAQVRAAPACCFLRTPFLQDKEGLKSTRRASCFLSLTQQSAAERSRNRSLRISGFALVGISEKSGLFFVTTQQRRRVPLPPARRNPGFRQLFMCVNSRLNSIRTGPRPGLSAVARRPDGASSVGRAKEKGHLKVAHYEVVGRVFSKATRPASARDDRSAACAREAVCHGLRVRSSLRDGAIFNAFCHRSGRLSNVPSGTDSLARWGGAI
jgi:hypothetical protein